MVNRISLLILIGISIISRNKSLMFGGIIVLILSFLNKDYVAKIDKNIFFTIGLTFLMIWVLMPLIENGEEQSILDFKSYFNIHGIVSILSGFFVVVFAARGLDLMNSNISVLSGVLIGSILGVTFFGGIPVGIFSGSGIAYLILKLINVFYKI